MEVIDTIVRKPVILDSLEKEAENTICELRLFGCITTYVLWLDGVHDVHLEVQKLTINGMLRRSMEMSLKSEQFSRRDMSIEQSDGRSCHHIFFWLSLKDNLVLLSLFLELDLSRGINVLVLDGEAVILVVLEDLQGTVEVDRCLQLSERTNVIRSTVVLEFHNIRFHTLTLLLVVVVLLIPLLEVAWAFLEWIMLVLSEIVLVNHPSVVSAIWHVTDDWQSVFLHHHVGLDDVAALGLDSSNLVEVVDIIGCDGWY